MSALRAATLFSGFDGAGVGMQAAGFEIAWGLEINDAIAAVARMNGHNVITGDILTANPAGFETVDALHISPPCTRASVANGSAEENEDGLRESQLDIDLANASIRFVEALRPRIVTVENVWGYRKFQSFRGGKKCGGILPALERLGYWVDVQHVNAADYGVPQSRRRLILRAVMGAFVPMLPEPEPWRGWYEAIEDLIPTLPESRFAPWQSARLPEEMKTILVNTRETHHGDGITADSGDTPAYTLAASSTGDRHKAFLVAGGNATHDNCTRLDAEPSWTVGDTNRVGNIPRAWLSHGRVVKMTTRALARFQTFPDSYRLSGNDALDCKGIGNACPPKLFEKLYWQLREAVNRD